MTGASVDADVFTMQAGQIAQALINAGVEFDMLDALYTRWCDDNLHLASSRGQVVTAHGLLAAYYTIRAELDAAEALEHEQRLREYRAEQQRLLAENPRPVTHVTDFAKRVDLEAQDWRKPGGIARGSASYPIPSPEEDLSSGQHRSLLVPTATTPSQGATGEPEKPQEARSGADGMDHTGSGGSARPGASEGLALLQAEERARKARNREAWHRLSAEHERIADNTPEGSNDDDH
jgi:hypothetical protein